MRAPLSAGPLLMGQRSPVQCLPRGNLFVELLCQDWASVLLNHASVICKGAKQASRIAKLMCVTKDVIG